MKEWRDGDWEVSCDARDGGRIGSICWRGRELLTQPHLIDGSFQAPADDLGEYETRPVFGYDDCWPCLEACSWSGMGRQVRDHGELVWREWEVCVEDGALVGQVGDTGWRFDRRTSSIDGVLVFDYVCANTGDVPFPMSWAGHVLIAPEAVMNLSLPGHGRLAQGSMHGGGKPFRGQGDIWTYLQSQPRGEATFVVLGSLSSSCLRLRLDDLDWRWSVDGIAHPAIGLWYNLRGYPSGELARAEFGIEWMTSPACTFDDPAQLSDSLVLQPGEEHRWQMRWEIALTSRLNTTVRGAVE